MDKKFCDMCNVEIKGEFAFFLTREDDRLELCKKCENIIMRTIKRNKK